MSHVLQPIPAIEVSAGQCALPPKPGPGLGGGTGTVLEAAERWRHNGAHWVHVVDMDARAGTGSNADAIKDAAHHVKGHLRFQLDAAVCNEEQLNEALALGVERVVIDVGGAHDLAWVTSALTLHQQRVAAGISAHGTDLVDPAGAITSDLWQTVIDLDVAGCPRFVVTESAKRGHWFHEDQHVLAAICESVKHPVIANGGIKHLEDLHGLVDLTKHGLEAAIIHEPLVAGKFTLQEAVTAVEPRFDPYEWGPARA